MKSVETFWHLKNTSSLSIKDQTIRQSESVHLSSSISPSLQRTAAQTAVPQCRSQLLIGIYYAVAHRWKTAAKQPKKCTANLRLAFYCRPFVPFHPPHHNSTEVYGSCQGGGTVSYRFVGETCLGKLTLMTTSWPTLCSPFHTAITGGLHHFQTWHRSNALAIFLSTSESAATWRTRGFWDQGSLVFVFVRVILQGVFQEFNELFQDCTWMFGRDSPAPGPPHKRKCNTVSTMNHEFKIHYVHFTSHDIHYTILQSTRYTSNPAVSKGTFQVKHLGPTPHQQLLIRQDVVLS